MAVATNNISFCTQSNYWSQKCITELAAANVDESLCKNDGCIWNVAVAKNDTSLCEKIADQKTKEHCLSSIKSISGLREMALSFFNQ